MIILRSPEDGPWERRPGGGEQAPVRAPVRRAPGARGGSVPLRSPGILGPRAGACPPAGATQAREFRIPNGVGARRGRPLLECAKNCAQCSPPWAVGALRCVHGARAERTECARSARTERARSACSLRSAPGARTERARNVHGVRARSGVRAARVRTSRGSSSGVLRMTLGSCALVVGSCPQELLHPVGAAHGSSCIPWELPTGAPASRRSCPRELLHPVGAAHGSSCIPSELLTGAPPSRRSCSFGG